MVWEECVSLFYYIIIESGMENKRILVACSKLDFLLISKILRNGFILDYTEDSGEIIRKSQEVNYTLLLIDVCFLKSDANLSLTLQKKGEDIIGLSSEPSDARAGKIKEISCKACYVKPFQPVAFASFIKHWCH